ncbi:MAG TPA: amino acid permease [Gemmatimonadota bacterium]|nr:amino acid permease [Gemmatimonadota bacterium]
MGGRTELSRDLGFFAVFSIASGTMIGAGIFVLPSVAAAQAGPGAALSFLFAGMISMVAALSVCELATGMPKAGGSYYFISRSMGPILGSIVGLGSWLGLIFKGAFALEGFGEYAATFHPFPITVAAAGLGIGLVVVNLIGGKASGFLQNLIVALLLGILGFFVTRGFMEVRMEAMRPLLPHGWSGVFSTTGLVFVSYLGVVKASAVAEEVRDPGKTFPRAVLSAVAVVTLLYVLVMLVVTGVILQERFVRLDAPLVEAGKIVLGAFGGISLAVAGLLATASTGNAAILSSSRYPFAMSRDGLMTEWFSRIHRRFRTPFRSILVTGALMVGLAVLLEVEMLAKLGSVFNIVVFALLNVAVLLLRRVDPEWYRPRFRAPGYPWLQIVGTIVTLTLLTQMGWVPQLVSVLFLLGGVGWYYFHRGWSKSRPIQPGYGLRDHLQRVRQLQAMDVKREAAEVEQEITEQPGSVLVELLPDKPNAHLITIAASIARRYDSRIEAVVFIEVPFQSPLVQLEEIDPEYEQRVLEKGRAHGCDIHLHQVVGRDRAQGLLSMVRESTHAVLLDWHDRFRVLHLRDSYVDEILKRSPVRVGVLKYRGIDTYERILVVSAGGPYGPAEVQVADSIARLTEAELTLIMVVPPDSSDARFEHAQEYLEELRELTETHARLEVVPGEDPVVEILRAAGDHDLVVIGASRSPRYRKYLFGRTPDLVARYSESSVLMVKDPQMSVPWSHRLMSLISRGR